MEEQPTEALLNAGINTNFDASEMEMLQQKTEKLQQQERRQKEWQNRFTISEYASSLGCDRCRGLPSPPHQSAQGVALKFHLPAPASWDGGDSDRRQGSRPQ